MFQSATADKLMRLLIAKPELADALSGASPRAARTKPRRVQARSLTTPPKTKAQQRRKAS